MWSDQIYLELKEHFNNRARGIIAPSTIRGLYHVLEKIVKKPKAGVAEVCLIEVYVDSCNNEQCYFMVDTMVYVPASHLNRDFVTTENIVRWEIATQSDIDEHNIL